MENDELIRLEQVAKKYFSSLGNLSTLIGRSRQFLYTYKKRSGIGKKLLKELEDKCKINPEYIRSGKGLMLLFGSNATILDLEHVSEPLDSYLPDNIPIYSLPVHANVGTLEAMEDLPITYQPFNVGSNTKNLIGFKVSGRSMEEAGISEGDLVFVDKKTLPINGDLIVCILNGTVMLKRYEKKDEIIHLHSAYNGTKPIIINRIDDVFHIIGVAIYKFGSLRGKL